MNRLTTCNMDAYTGSSAAFHESAYTTLINVESRLNCNEAYLVGFLLGGFVKLTLLGKSISLKSKTLRDGAAAGGSICK